MNRDVSEAEIALARLDALDFMTRGAGFFYTRLLADGRVIYLAPAGDGAGHVKTEVIRLGIARDAFIRAYYAYWDYPIDGGAVLGYRAALGWDGQGEPIDGWLEHNGETR